MDRLFPKTRWPAAVAVLVSLCAAPAQALPGFFATASETKTSSNSTQIAVLMNGEDTVVTLMTDYTGPNKPFALVLPVPKDTSFDQVKVLKRGALDRIDELTAPRFHEFWEKDPCEEGETIQKWERNTTASASTDFLGGGKMFEGGAKAPIEMRTSIDTDFRDTGHEYELALVTSDLVGHLKSKGLRVPAGINLDSLGDYNFLVAMVDPKKGELGGQGELLLSPLRYATKSKLTLLSTLGLVHADGPQELLIYAIHPDKRMAVQGYPNVFPPTNLAVDFIVKEKMGDFYAALHDQVAAKNPGAFLTEFAWDAKGCGEPCPDAPLRINELLTLGVDVLELSVPEADRHPEPPPLSPEEEKALKALEKEERERKEEVRVEVMRRKGMFARHEKYVMTRLHHRYTKDTLPKDIVLVAAAPASGGVDVPKGANGELPQGEKASSVNRFQTRLVHLHPDKTVVKCEKPERYRWGIPPRTYRGANKIWVADQLGSRNRTRIKPQDVVLTAVPSLGIKGHGAESEAEKAAEGDARPKESKCDCAVVGAPKGGLSLALLLGLGAFGVLFSSRVRRRKAADRN